MNVTTDQLKSAEEKAAAYNRLARNKDFQFWKESQIENRLKTLFSEAMKHDLGTEAGRLAAITNLIAYKELKKSSEEIFKVSEYVEGQAKDLIKAQRTGYVAPKKEF